MTTPTPDAAPRPSRVATASAAGVVVLALAGYGLASGPRRFQATGDRFPGAATATAQLVGQFAATLAATLCLGALIFILTTAIPDAAGRLDAATFRVHLLLERASPLWAALAAAMVVIDAAARTGISAAQLVTSAALLDAVAANETSRGWCAAAVCAGIVAIGTRFTVRWTGHVLLLIPAVLGVLAVAVTGNAGQGPDHDVATSAAIVFAVALSILTGVQVVAAHFAPAGIMVRRILLLCLTAGVATLAYGAILAPLMLAGTPLLGSGFGWLTLIAAALVMLTVALDVIALRRPSAGYRLTAPAAMCAVAATGALAATAVLTPPRFLVHPPSVYDIYLGYQLPGPVTVGRLATTWRFDPFLGAAAIGLALAYTVGVVVLRRRGDGWPAGRTLAWMSGCLALLLATSSGVRAYGSAMFSVHMGEHMALNMFIPVLLVLGAPITLLLRALRPAGSGQPPGPREWVLRMVHAPVTRFLSHPVTAFLLFVGSLYAVYFTPLFDTLVRYHWGHEFMSVHFLLTGYLFYWGIIGIDPGPKRLPFIGRLGLLFAVMPFHAFFGIATMTMTTPIGANFYRILDLPWVSSLTDDQHLGGAIAWGSSELPVVIVVVALVAQWARQDRRAGARHDRHADTGHDDDLDAYNAMLAELARNRR